MNIDISIEGYYNIPTIWDVIDLIDHSDPNIYVESGYLQYILCMYDLPMYIVHINAHAVQRNIYPLKKHRNRNKENI